MYLNGARDDLYQEITQNFAYFALIQPLKASFTSNNVIHGPFSVFHTEGGVPWDFPPQSTSFPPQDLLPLLYCDFVLLSHPKWHQLPNIVISKAMVLYETLILVCNSAGSSRWVTTVAW